MTFRSAVMSAKADGPAAEEEETSGLYYSDEDDDLGAFSDAEIGCEDGGRTTAEGHEPRQKRRLWLQRSCVEERALAAVARSSEIAHFRHFTSCDGRSFGFMAPQLPRDLPLM